MRVGIVQLGSTGSKEENVNKFLNILEKGLDRADIVVVPEYFMFFSREMLSNSEIVYENSETLEGSFVRSMCGICREFSINLIFTMFERLGGSVYNSAVLMSKDGSILLVYRKIHLFDAYGFSESRMFCPGIIPSKVVDICGVKVSIAICFDIRFPELFRVYALSGSEVTFVPAAWFRGDYKEEILRVLAQARAHENGMYIIVCDQYSDMFVGRSMVIEPSGTVAVDLGHGERYVEYEVDRCLVRDVRERVPVLRLRRPLSYSRILL
ncbi:MAG: carbon-nitrogen hydrolase family protein [Crenarchaeota archaeon]|nr:carbon-nitrogen hydrolase family protein [Thermoproteota archaeon]